MISDREMYKNDILLLSFPCEEYHWDKIFSKTGFALMCEHSLDFMKRCSDLNYPKHFFCRLHSRWRTGPRGGALYSRRWRKVNKERRRQECTPVFMNCPPCLSLVSLLSLSCFHKQSQKTACRRFRHLFSEVGPGQDDHFVETMLSQHKIGKTDSMHERATGPVHYTPLPPIFPLLRWEDGGV